MKKNAEIANPTKIPCDWYIYLHLVDFFLVFMHGKYTVRPMDGLFSFFFPQVDSLLTSLTHGGLCSQVVQMEGSHNETKIGSTNLIHSLQLT